MDAVTPIRTACVTGGAGFIGSHVVDVLLERGCKRVLVLDDLSTGRLENVNEDAAFVQADVSTVRAIAEIEREQLDVIFHLAAQTDVQTSFREPANDALANVFGVLRIAEAAKRCGAKVVFASTGGAMYGDAAPASEDTPPDPRSPYAVSKLAGEGYLRCLLPGSVILRYANVYGPRQSAALEGGVAAIFTEARRQSKYATVFGDGLQTRDFVHVSDVAAATVAAANLDGGTFNVGTGVETSIRELADTIGVDHKFANVLRHGDLTRSALDSSRLSLVLGRWEPLSLTDGLHA